MNQNQNQNQNRNRRYRFHPVICEFVLRQNKNRIFIVDIRDDEARLQKALFGWSLWISSIIDLCKSRHFVLKRGFKSQTIETHRDNCKIGLVERFYNNIVVWILDPQLPVFGIDREREVSFVARVLGCVTLDAPGHAAGLTHRVSVGRSVLVNVLQTVIKERHYY